MRAAQSNDDDHDVVGAMTHKLLARQLREHFGSAAGVPEALGPFIASVESAYGQSDADRSMLEHSLETMSEELVDRFRLLNAALAESRQAEGSINQTLSRTILTTLTVFMVILALYFFGGEVINDFAFTMLVGVISGTYSTVYIAAPVLVDWPGARKR